MAPPRHTVLWGLSPLLFALAGCPTPAEEIPEQLSLSGSLDRDSVNSSNSIAVPIQFVSEGARGDWWPCDLRLTAQGCVDDFHVNVYVALPSVTSLDGVGGGACVSGDTAAGVYEALEARGKGDYDIGQDVSVFVLVASDKDDAPGARIESDDETLAATRLESGTFRVDRWAGLTAIGVTIDGVTAEGRQVTIQFQGPTLSGDVALLEAPGTCVEDALVEP